MNILSDIADIFSIFHDGRIVAFEENAEGLQLTIECQYLAERINPKHEWFYVELLGVEKLEFEIWPNPITLPIQIFTRSKEIFQAELEILSAEIIGNDVRITCNQHNTNYDYCGGNVFLNCNTIKIYDQDKNELPIDFMDKICNEYWNRAND
jgi:hypothetical protein